MEFPKKKIKNASLCADVVGAGEEGDEKLDDDDLDNH